MGADDMLVGVADAELTMGVTLLWWLERVDNKS